MLKVQLCYGRPEPKAPGHQLISPVYSGKVSHMLQSLTPPSCHARHTTTESNTASQQFRPDQTKLSSPGVQALGEISRALPYLRHDSTLARSQSSPVCVVGRICGLYITNSRSGPRTARGEQRTDVVSLARRESTYFFLSPHAGGFFVHGTCASGVGDVIARVAGTRRWVDCWKGEGRQKLEM